MLERGKNWLTKAEITYGAADRIPEFWRDKVSGQG